MKIFKRLKDWWYYGWRHSCIVNCYYWFYNHLIRKPHIVDSGLACHYHDVVELMPAVLFQLVIRFIEKERAFEIVDWDFTQESKDAKKKLDVIYHFIKIRKPKFEKLLEKSLMHNKHDFSQIAIDFGLNFFDTPENNIDKKRRKLYSKLEEQFEEEIDATLVDIVKLRRILWT